MVYSPLQAAAKYFRYYVHAANSKGHGTHSPFVFEFITKVMNDFTKYEDYSKVEDLRKLLLSNNTSIKVDDLGAGSTATKSNIRTITSIAKNAAKPKKFGQLLYRMVKYYQPKNVLELGTSLGITSSYLALANPTANLVTMEGSESICEVARSNFESLQLKNIELVQGNFDTQLQSVLDGMGQVDFAFIDGNHRKEPTERYFHQILPHIHNDTILIFDDIHWSKEMETAWRNIVQHEAVACDIDLFYIGIISFRKEFQEKQRFSVRF
ncbi:MAG TPA: class I SAM-dependent methyltransferase [Niabella sp.]|nr:class I SAM-dependent methyltransferase [Niabella sp.]HOZ95658.1 class I SAM-dependent methyltransferase [Niabella sp.]HQW13898.1 class I SAM-dependent methyltransferase [Niabella sp.]HQX19209.1 class I SAM-dependent methyltransferase [Niabella sp.]HQX42259.1 class I SAM-dependent methyltransferase [Niabella sp.]